MEPLSFAMTKFAPVFLAALMGCSSAFAFTTPSEKLFRTDGSAGDTQAAINAAAENATIQLPAGTFTWTSQVKMTKALKLQGAGAGRIIARSTTSSTIGTGSKTLAITVDSRQDVSITPGQTLRIVRTGARGNFMEGTVSTYSSGNLVMSITKTGGSGTHAVWFIATPPATSIVHGTGDTIMLDVTTSAEGRTEISGIKFQQNGPAPNGYMLHLKGSKTKPTPVIHDCWWQTDDGGFIAIRTATNNMLVYNTSFDSSFGLSEQSLHIASYDDDAWGTADTMGTRDTNGNSNVYIENCDFHGCSGICDLDDSAKAVFRRNLFDNSIMGSHGADTSNVGMRHVEIYENEFVQTTQPGSTFNMGQWFFWRGGTGVITDNVMPNLFSSDWGDKAEIFMTVLNLWRNGGPYACWGASYQNGAGKSFGAAPPVTSVSAGNPAVVTTATEHYLPDGAVVRFASSLTGVVPDIRNSTHVVKVLSPTTFTIPLNIITGNENAAGVLLPIDYPAPRQQGQGHNGNSTFGDPIYIWNNTSNGTTPYSPEVRINDDAAGNTCGPYADSALDYIKIGRDVINDSRAKPGYAKYEYPHPVRKTIGGTGRPQAPSNLKVVP